MYFTCKFFEFFTYRFYLYVSDIEFDKWIAWLEKQGEQTTDKIESKFKVGDWVVQENIGTYKVIEVCESWYEVIDNQNNHYSIGFDKEDMRHLWTINDAKDGDVLTFHDEYIFIYNNTCILQAYCYYHTRNDKFYVEDRTHHHKWVMSEVYPATKEQQDMLFEKIKNAGYEWNTAKKKLKKIKL